MGEILIYSAVYLIPTFLMLYFTIDILARNRSRREHQLLAVFFTCYAVMFFSEFLRHLLPIRYSEAVVMYVFGNAGLIIPSVFLHFMMEFSGLKRKFPRFLYPWVLYLSLIPVVLTFITGENLTNSSAFQAVGMFYYPELDGQYYLTLTAANGFGLAIAGITWSMYKKESHSRKKSLLGFLVITLILGFLWTTIFGYFDFRGVMIPYPYIISSLIWAIAISYAMRKLDFLESSYKRFETFFNVNPSAIVLVNPDGDITQANPAAEQLFQSGNLQGASFRPFIAESARADWDEEAERLTHLGSGFRGFESKIQNTLSEERFVLIDSGDVTVDSQPMQMLILQDIHRRKEADRKAAFLAYHDALTGLPNRRHFYNEAQKRLTAGLPFTLIIIDLDSFKEINDTYGHQTGDAFLIHIAKLFKTAFDTTEGGFASRIGGDEFYAILPDTDERQSEIFLTALLQQFATNPYLAGEIPLEIRASMGTSRYPSDTDSLDELVQFADRAMYHVKNAGKNSHASYSTISRHFKQEPRRAESP